MQVNIQKLTPSAIIPTYAHEGDAGADLYSIETYVIPPRETVVVRTGLSIEIPVGYEGQIRSRSGLACKFGVAVVNSPGTIDSGYRGEIKVALINHGDECYRLNAGDRIAQLIIAPVVRAEFQLESTFDKAAADLQFKTTFDKTLKYLNRESGRGTGGFGSTGS